MAVQPADWTEVHLTQDQRSKDGYNLIHPGNLTPRDYEKSVFFFFQMFFPLRAWLNCGPEMQQLYEFHHGDDAVQFDEATLCAWLGIVLLLSLYDISVDEFYKLNILDVSSKLAKYKFQRICRALRWPEMSKVLTTVSDDDGSEMILTQGRSGFWEKKFAQI